MQHRDEIAQAYFDLLPFAPYPVQEEALLAWFTSDQGVLVCAPTGTGKTLIAEAAVFEALRLGKTAYYTTPLIALTDQKFHELQESAVRWGFSADDIGLVTGNRKLNPQATILVVVAEILLNRLLHGEAFDFSDVWAVVMDEFHSFNDPERGLVWEFGLSLLPKHVRTLLLSATVGNAAAFTSWLASQHDRRLLLIQSDQRKVPLTYQWVADELLSDHLEVMVRGDETTRFTPALIFCFNRELCWTMADQLKGKKVISPDQQQRLADILAEFDWSQGAGPKLKQLLIRGIGVHHAGVLPRYRRIVEQLFQDKLLSFCVCTETLAAGINLPARSVVLPTLMKGPPDKLKLIDPSSAHQMFGRAGRPQYDTCGYVFALPHEDDVKIQRWKEKYDSIPDDTKDPGLIKAKKALKKKMPRRREGQQYWSEAQFNKLIQSPPVELASRGPLPWRLLVYLLDISPEIEPIRKLVNRRLLADRTQQSAQKELSRMLITLWRGGFVRLEPKPSLAQMGVELEDNATAANSFTSESTADTQATSLDLGQRVARIHPQTNPPTKSALPALLTSPRGEPAEQSDGPAVYQPKYAYPTDKLPELLCLRGVHPLYAVFLMKHLGIADRNERILAFESLLELPASVGPAIRIPPVDTLPPGPLATTRLDAQLLKFGLATAEEMGALATDDDAEEDRRGWLDEQDFVRVLTLPYKLQRLFQYDFPGVDDVRVRPVWAAGEVLNFGGDFNKYVTSHKLQKQEGVIFRHLLRMILLLDEMAALSPPDIAHEQWQDDLNAIADQLEETCRNADSYSTEQWLENAKVAIAEG